MPYADYLRVAGLCSVVLGLAMAVVAAPGLFVSYPNGWIGLLFVPVVIALIAGWAALRHGVSPLRPGEWLTARPLATASPGAQGPPRPRLVRRLLVETAAWIVGVTALVLLTGSELTPLTVFGTGLASAAFGALQAFPSRARVREVEATRGVRFRIAAPPRGVGAPRLGVDDVREGR